MEWSPDRKALRERVVVVAGATRGAGRGIAAALGETGATVICPGRTTRLKRSEYDRAETIEETAELVTQLGGVGVGSRPNIWRYILKANPSNVSTISTRL
jgi:NAD(P)-dependent dehydrogenase (short-subunit alcohol dehydrogenase family)